MPRMGLVSAVRIRFCPHSRVKLMKALCKTAVPVLMAWAILYTASAGLAQEAGAKKKNADVDIMVDKGLGWLKKTQAPDGTGKQRAANTRPR